MSFKILYNPNLIQKGSEGREFRCVELDTTFRAFDRVLIRYIDDGTRKMFKCRNGIPFEEITEYWGEVYV